MNIDELIESNKEFAEKYIKKERCFAPQIIISHKGDIIPIAISGDRSIVKDTISMIERVKDELDWILFMQEAYMEMRKITSKEVDKLKEYKHGSLEERFLAGNENIKWIFMLQAYWKDKEEGKTKWIKKARIYEIKTVSLNFELVSETENFVGFLTIDLEGKPK